MLSGLGTCSPLSTALELCESGADSAFATMDVGRWAVNAHCGEPARVMSGDRGLARVGLKTVCMETLHDRIAQGRGNGEGQFHGSLSLVFVDNVSTLGGR